MKIAIDISPIDPKTNSMHAVRGVGYYISHLKDALMKYDKTNDYSFFSSQHEIPMDTDVIHYPYFEPFFLTLPHNPSKKIVVTIHDLIPLVFPEHFPSGIKGKFRWLAQRTRLAKVHHILTDSENSKKDIVKFAKIPERKISVVYLAADEAFKPIDMSKKSREELQKKYGLPENFLLYVGDATWNKNIPRLIQAVRKASVPLVMVGKALTHQADNNPWNNDLLWLQKETIHDTSMKRLGYVATEDLVRLYNLAVALISPSLYEGFGLPCLEAMQSGCPVITTKESSLPEVAGDAALYVDAFDVDAIARGITAMFEDSSLREKLQKIGLEQAKKFSWEKVAKETIAAYETNY